MPHENGCSCPGPFSSTGETLQNTKPGQEDGKAPQILIVDDADNMRTLLSGYLESCGYHRILTAGSANEAFDRLTGGPDVPASRAVDLILMDIIMPGIDGIEACRRIKNDLGGGDVPVIMVTGEDGIIQLQQAFEAGAMDYVTKPFNKFELRVRVASALRLKYAMDAQKRANSLLEKSNQDLTKAIENVKILRGLLPICASCKNIRDDSGNWSAMEEYISENSEAVFSHGICPGCQLELYPEAYRRLQKKGLRPS